MTLIDFYTLFGWLMQLKDFSTDIYLLILKIWMANTVNEPTIVSAIPVVYEHPKAIIKSTNPMFPQWLIE